MISATLCFEVCVCIHLFCRIIQDLVAVIVKEIGALYKASEAVILLVFSYLLITN